MKSHILFIYKVKMNFIKIFLKILALFFININIILTSQRFDSESIHDYQVKEKTNSIYNVIDKTLNKASKDIINNKLNEKDLENEKLKKELENLNKKIEKENQNKEEKNKLIEQELKIKELEEKLKNKENELKETSEQVKIQETKPEEIKPFNNTIQDIIEKGIHRLSENNTNVVLKIEEPRIDENSLKNTIEKIEIKENNSEIEILENNLNDKIKTIETNISIDSNQKNEEIKKVFSEYSNKINTISKDSSDSSNNIVEKNVESAIVNEILELSKNNSNKTEVLNNLKPDEIVNKMMNKPEIKNCIEKLPLAQQETAKNKIRINLRNNVNSKLNFIRTANKIYEEKKIDNLFSNTLTTSSNINNNSIINIENSINTNKEIILTDEDLLGNLINIKSNKNVQNNENKLNQKRNNLIEKFNSPKMKKIRKGIKKVIKNRSNRNRNINNNHKRRKVK